MNAACGEALPIGTVEPHMPVLRARTPLAPSAFGGQSEREDAQNMQSHVSSTLDAAH